MAILVFLCVFIILYGTTTGPLLWVYTVETCCDVAVGVCIFELWATVVVLLLISQPLMNSALQPQGVFFLFAFFSLIDTLYAYFIIKETKGLNDKEKKSLYGPEEMMNIMPEVAAKWRDLSGQGDVDFFKSVKLEKEIRKRLAEGLKKQLTFTR